MSGPSRPKRLWGNSFQLQDLLSLVPGSLGIAEREFALLTIAAQLSVQYPNQLVFKGGFALRHVHGIIRFSFDVDATRHNPSFLQFDASEVAATIRSASIGDTIRFQPQEPPGTDSARSLDFDHVKFSGSLLSTSEVQVEISYREVVIDEPDKARIGAPFYEDFEILTMTVSEMASEKLRALAQRVRATDLADLAELLLLPTTRDEDISRLALKKFELVKQGNANRIDQIERNLQEISFDYDNVVPALFPGARSYDESMDIVWPRVKILIP